jgi:hypothetical protein
VIHGDADGHDIFAVSQRADRSIGGGEKLEAVGWPSVGISFSELCNFDRIIVDLNRVHVNASPDDPKGGRGSFPRATKKNLQSGQNDGAECASSGFPIRLIHFFDGRLGSVPCDARYPVATVRGERACPFTSTR